GAGGGAPGARVARGEAAAGEAVYRKSCVMCHGPDGGGTQLGPSLVTGDLAGVDQITQVVRAGVPDPEEYPVPMPDHTGLALTDAQVQAVSAYVYFLTGR
ncbi:MAG TPA: cytochrome c, partial [Longimicrobium sp.]|nr:cytochrome c [Longimicrobium sp.]